MYFLVAVLLFGPIGTFRRALRRRSFGLFRSKDNLFVLLKLRFARLKMRILLYDVCIPKPGNEQTYEYIISLEGLFSSESKPILQVNTNFAASLEMIKIYARLQGPTL